MTSKVVHGVWTKDECEYENNRYCPYHGMKSDHNHMEDVALAIWAVIVLAEILLFVLYFVR